MRLGGPGRRRRSIWTFRRREKCLASAETRTPDRPCRSLVTVCCVLCILYSFRYQPDRYTCRSIMSFTFRSNLLCPSSRRHSLVQFDASASSKYHPPSKPGSVCQMKAVHIATVFLSSASVLWAWCLQQANPATCLPCNPHAFCYPPHKEDKNWQLYRVVYLLSQLPLCFY